MSALEAKVLRRTAEIVVQGWPLIRAIMIAEAPAICGAIRKVVDQ